MAKKDKKNPANPSAGPGTVVPPTTPGGTPAIDTSTLTPEQMVQLQLEQAIKESTDPSSRLRKLHSPLSIKGCLLQLLILVVLTLTISFAFIGIFRVDRFELGTLVMDMLDKFGITGFFEMILNAIKGAFGIK